MVRRNGSRHGYPGGETSSPICSGRHPKGAPRILGDLSTYAETDDESLEEILGGPYSTHLQSEGKQDPTVIHLTYTIARSKEDDSGDNGEETKRARKFLKELHRKGCKTLAKSRSIIPSSVSALNISSRFGRRKTDQYPSTKPDEVVDTEKVTPTSHIGAIISNTSNDTQPKTQRTRSKLPFVKIFNRKRKIKPKNRIPDDLPCDSSSVDDGSSYSGSEGTVSAVMFSLNETSN